MDDWREDGQAAQQHDREIEEERLTNIICKAYNSTDMSAEDARLLCAAVGIDPKEVL